MAALQGSLWLGNFTGGLMMRGMCLRRPSPAMAVALIALFVALGGSGYAAVKINGKNITSRSIAGSKLKKSAVTGTEVKNASLGVADFKAGQLPAGPQGPTGSAGMQGPAGVQGPAGANGSAVGFAYVQANAGTVTVNPAFAQNVTAANITRASAGVYCFHDLPFTPRSLMVMGEAHGFYDSLAKGSMTSTFGCAFPPNQAVVQIQRPVSNPGGCCHDDDFIVWFE
jgi:hypothetical protein